MNKHLKNFLDIYGKEVINEYIDKNSVDTEMKHLISKIPQRLREKKLKLSFRLKNELRKNKKINIRKLVKREIKKGNLKQTGIGSNSFYYKVKNTKSRIRISDHVPMTDNSFYGISHFYTFPSLFISIKKYKKTRKKIENNIKKIVLANS
ncbi:MAG TPA: hypothetical protein VMZ91_03585 [Candidatus Paceibacterota bacterium]|nr:hypothetical protein [Candidatus Paceibacterota bacterium]